jgi:hypothetical protein
VRARLDRPVSDCDGHVVEVFPVMFDNLKLVDGPGMGIDFIAETAISAFEKLRR